MPESLVTNEYVNTFVAILLLGLRLGPTLLFAPPFTYLRIPPAIRALLCLALAGWLVAGHPGSTLLLTVRISTIVTAAICELMIGLAFSLSLQIAFAGILTAGRTIDFQAGFGLAVLADPTLKTQMPLIGTVLAYGAAAVFFLTSGPADLLAVWSASLDRLPLGALAVQPDIVMLAQIISTAFAMSFGLAGLTMLTLMLADISIAFLSRTLPQMNVLVLGFQVKTIVLLVTLPLALSVGGSLFARLMRLAIESTPKVLG